MATPHQSTRRRLALEARSSQKAPEKSKPQPKHGAQAPPPTKKSVDDLYFKQVHVARTKNEEVPRCQITAIVDVDGDDKRIHVLTITRNKRGSIFSKTSDELEQFCRLKNATKSKAIAFRKSLYSKDV